MFSSSIPLILPRLLPGVSKEGIFNLEWLSHHQVSFNFPNWQMSSTRFPWKKTKQPSCGLHQRAPNNIFERRRVARRWDRSRGSDFRCISKAIFCMEKMSCNLKGVTTLQLEKWLNLQDPFSSDFKAKISDAYRIFAELVQDKNSTRYSRNLPNCRLSSLRQLDNWFSLKKTRWPWPSCPMRLRKWGMWEVPMWILGWTCELWRLWLILLNLCKCLNSRKHGWISWCEWEYGWSEKEAYRATAWKRGRRR